MKKKSKNAVDEPVRPDSNNGGKNTLLRDLDRENVALRAQLTTLKIETQILRRSQNQQASSSDLAMTVQATPRGIGGNFSSLLPPIDSTTPRTQFTHDYVSTLPTVYALAAPSGPFPIGTPADPCSMSPAASGATSPPPAFPPRGATFDTTAAGTSSAHYARALLPYPPRSVTAQAGASHAIVHWQPPLYTVGPPIVGYVIAAQPDGPVVRVDDGTARSAVVNGLVDGLSYSFVVSAANAFGVGAASIPSQDVIPLPPDITAGVAEASARPVRALLAAVHSFRRRLVGIQGKMRSVGEALQAAAAEAAMPSPVRGVRVRVGVPSRGIGSGVDLPEALRPGAGPAGGISPGGAHGSAAAAAAARKAAAPTDAAVQHQLESVAARERSLRQSLSEAEQVVVQIESAMQAVTDVFDKVMQGDVGHLTPAERKILFGASAKRALTRARIGKRRGRRSSHDDADGVATRQAGDSRGSPRSGAGDDTSGDGADEESEDSADSVDRLDALHHAVVTGAADGLAADESAAKILGAAAHQFLADDTARLLQRAEDDDVSLLPSLHDVFGEPSDASSLPNELPMLHSNLLRANEAPRAAVLSLRRTLAAGFAADAAAGERRVRPLHAAVYGGCTAAVEALIGVMDEAKLPVDAPDAAGVTPLMIAAAMQRHLVPMLINAGARVSVADASGRTPLLWALGAGDQHPTAPDAAGGGSCGVYTDAPLGPSGAVRGGGDGALSGRGVGGGDGADGLRGDNDDPSRPPSAPSSPPSLQPRPASNRATPRWDTPSAIGGSDGASIADTSERPAVVARERALLATVRLLLQRGADPNAVSKDRHVALVLAAGSAPRAVAQALISAGADVRRTAPGAVTVLHAAARHPRDGVGAQWINYVTALGGVVVMLVDALTADGTSAVGIAVASSNLQCLNALLAAGANPTVGGMPPLLLAVLAAPMPPPDAVAVERPRCDPVDMARALLTAGATAHVTDGDPHSCADAAAALQRTDLLALFANPPPAVTTAQQRQHLLAAQHTAMAGAEVIRRQRAALLSVASTHKKVAIVEPSPAERQLSDADLDAPELMDRSILDVSVSGMTPQAVERYERMMTHREALLRMLREMRDGRKAADAAAATATGETGRIAKELAETKALVDGLMARRDEKEAYISTLRQQLHDQATLLLAFQQHCGLEVPPTSSVSADLMRALTLHSVNPDTPVGAPQVGAPAPGGKIDQRPKPEVGAKAELGATPRAPRAPVAQHALHPSGPGELPASPAGTVQRPAASPAGGGGSFRRPPDTMPTTSPLAVGDGLHPPPRAGRRASLARGADEAAPGVLGAGGHGDKALVEAEGAGDSLSFLDTSVTAHAAVSQQRRVRPGPQKV